MKCETCGKEKTTLLVSARCYHCDLSDQVKLEEESAVTSTFTGYEHASDVGRHPEPRGLLPSRMELLGQGSLKCPCCVACTHRNWWADGDGLDCRCAARVSLDARFTLGVVLNDGPCPPRANCRKEMDGRHSVSQERMDSGREILIEGLERPRDAGSAVSGLSWIDHIRLFDRLAHGRSITLPTLETSLDIVDASLRKALQVSDPPPANMGASRMRDPSRRECAGVKK